MHWRHKKDRWSKGLVQWRNNPRADGHSPAQVIFGHPARDSLPVHKCAFAAEWQHTVCEANPPTNEQHQKLEYRYASACELPPLHPRTLVAVQNHATKRWDTYGTIVAVDAHHDNLISLTSGHAWRRYRRFIRRRFPTPNPPDADHHVLNPRPLPQHPQRDLVVVPPPPHKPPPAAAPQAPPRPPPAPLPPPLPPPVGLTDTPKGRRRTRPHDHPHHMVEYYMWLPGRFNW